MSEPIDSRILRRLGSAERILDVGCGDGRLVTFLAYRTRRKVVGLDISSQGFEADGKVMSWTMPRWQMSDPDLNELIEYLKTLE